MKVTGIADWGKRAQTGFLASGIDPADRRGHKNLYIDILQKMALEEVLEMRGNETVLDFGCGSGRMTYWLAGRVKKVTGLEVTPEMIQLAEERRKPDNVEFILYDGIHFPVFSRPFDFILSVGVVQIMEGETLAKTVSELARCLGPQGKIYLIEQVSDNPTVGRPRLKDYLRAFEASGLEPLKHYPIRAGRGWLLYLIRYGLIPRAWFPEVAEREILRSRTRRGPVSYYQDHLFVLQRKLWEPLSVKA